MIIGITPYSTGDWIGVRHKFALIGGDPRVYVSHSRAAAWNIGLNPKVVRGKGFLTPIIRPKDNL